MTTTTSTTPKFFLAQPSSVPPLGPAAVSFSAPLQSEGCPGCGAPIERFVGPGECDFEGGENWTDWLRTAGTPPIVSERVVATLRSLQTRPLAAYPVRPRDVRGRALKRLSPPSYFYLDLPQGLELDLERSDASSSSRCRVCFGGPGRIASTFVAREATWSGDSIFRWSNYASMHVIAAFEVVRVACEHEWSGVRFDPLGLTQQQMGWWAGVDLHAGWPPPAWSPTSPAADKSVDWIAQLRSADSKVAYKARVALLELGANATSLVLPLLDESDDALRREAAVILYGIHRQSPLPDQIRAKIRPLLAPHLAALV